MRQEERTWPQQAEKQRRLRQIWLQAQATAFDWWSLLATNPKVRQDLSWLLIQSKLGALQRLVVQVVWYCEERDGWHMSFLSGVFVHQKWKISIRKPMYLLGTAHLQPQYELCAVVSERQDYVSIIRYVCKPNSNMIILQNKTMIFCAGSVASTQPS